MLLNLILEEEIEDETSGVTANVADAEEDGEEWARIRKGVGERRDVESGETEKRGEASA